MLRLWGMFERAFDVLGFPSLTVQPWLYPDGRGLEQRTDFAYRSGRVFPFRSPPDVAGLEAWFRESGGVGLEGRVALLAVGSNAYPRQLYDKMRGSPADAEGLITVRARVAGVDVAYCPIRSRKGYVPVTLALRPGAATDTWLQWLTPAQLELISATEGPRYALAGGRALSALVRLASPLPRPERVYAWWFDSVLRSGAGAVWLDDHAQHEVGEGFDGFGSAAQAPPAGWEIVDRGGANWATRIAQL